MLRKSSSPLIGWFDTAAVCCSDLRIMPASRSRVRRTQFCSLCLSHGLVIVVDPPVLNPWETSGTALHAETRVPSRWPHPHLLNTVEVRWIGGLLPPSQLSQVACHSPS